jgi:hypothetical protein
VRSRCLSPEARGPRPVRQRPAGRRLNG